MPLFLCSLQGTGVDPRLLFLICPQIKEASPTSDANLIQSLLRLFMSVALPVLGTPELSRKLGNEVRIHAAVDGLFAFSATWSLACTAATCAGRAAISGLLRSAAAGALGVFVSPAGRDYSGDAVGPPLAGGITNLPQDGDLHEWMYDAATVTWKRWEDLTSKADSEIPADASFGQIIVPTADSASYTFLLKTAVENK